jgi:hypothetical protein
MIPTETDIDRFKRAFRSKHAPKIGLRNDFFAAAGVCPYLLLSWLAAQERGKSIVVADAGNGLSSVALAFETSNLVHAFVKDDALSLSSYPNVLRHPVSLMDAGVLETWKETVLDSAIIFLDLAGHAGDQEHRLYEFLRENHYKGLVVCDHMWEKKTMRDSFLYRIPEANRCDVSLLGNCAGTFLVAFSETWLREFTDKKVDLSKWTLVTAYFNLTRCPDASNEIKARDAAYYFQHATYTLCSPYNLVVYCDEESLPTIQAIRPVAYKTKYVVTRFDDIRVAPDAKTFAEYRLQIAENRQRKPYRFDPRNTPSYYLFCLSRYWMMRETIAENPFGSTHFCWINFCMERMGYKNILHLEECLSLYRDKFSTCYIDFVPEQLVQNTAEYFQVGRCSMCSGFFTGAGDYMSQVAGLIIDKFRKYVAEGYGHADEQLYSPVFFENKGLFEPYFGDYSEMITNYKYIYERATEPVHNFIRNSFQHGQFDLCLTACRVLLESLALGKCQLDDNYKRHLEHYFSHCTSRLGA